MEDLNVREGKKKARHSRKSKGVKRVVSRMSRCQANGSFFLLLLLFMATSVPGRITLAAFFRFFSFCPVRPVWCLQGSSIFEGLRCVRFKNGNLKHDVKNEKKRQVRRFSLISLTHPFSLSPVALCLVEQVQLQLIITQSPSIKKQKKKPRECKKRATTNKHPSQRSTLICTSCLLHHE